jgi:hypothetical protein
MKNGDDRGERDRGDDGDGERYPTESDDNEARGVTSDGADEHADAGRLEDGDSPSRNKHNPMEHSETNLWRSATVCW